MDGQRSWRLRKSRRVKAQWKCRKTKREAERQAASGKAPIFPNGYFVKYSTDR
jgi:hypothetical protein